MSKLLLLDDADVQEAFAAYLRKAREEAGLSREALAKRSHVPAPTIKKFELTGRISFRQLLLLWQSLDDLTRFYALTQRSNDLHSHSQPKTIAEVLKDDL